MDQEEELLQLVTDIQEWLATLPDRTGILEYLRALPEVHYETAQYAALLFLDNLIDRTHRYWQSQTLNIHDILDPIDELDFINALAQYNTRSVFLSFQKKFPQLIVKENISELNTWAADFLDQWETANTLLNGPMYLRRLVDAHTLLSRFTDLASLDVISNVFADIYKQDERVVAEGREQDQAEIEAQRVALEKLNFFPTDYVANLLDPLHYEEKAELLASFMSGIEAIKASGLEALRQDPELLNEVIWEVTYNRQVVKSLVYLQKNFHTTTPDQKKVLDWLSTAFTVSSLTTEKFFTDLTAFISQMGIQNKGFIVKEFRAFLCFSPVAEVLADPLNVRGMLDQIDQNKNNAVHVTDIILTAANDIPDEEQRKLAVKIFTIYFNLVKI